MNLEQKQFQIHVIAYSVGRVINYFELLVTIKMIFILCCRIAAIFNIKENGSDNAMISVYPFCDELYAFSETTTIYRINKETLATEQKVDVSKNVSIVNHTSHPHVVDDGI